MQKVSRTPGCAEVRPTRRFTTRHIARFILLALYTGTRLDAVLGASFVKTPGMGWIDLEKGIFHRLREGKTETNKRQPPARIPDRLLHHLRRWHRLGISKRAVIEWNGKPITTSVKTGFGRVVREAGLDKHVTPHTLRYTAATWLMNAGHDAYQVSGFLGMSPKILDSTYAKHHPDYQREMKGAFGRTRVSK